MKEIPASLREKVTSLGEIVGKPIDITAALILIAGQMHRLLAHRDDTSFRAIIGEYDRHHALLGRRVTVTQSPGEPVVTGRWRRH